MSDDSLRRRELGAFLRACRAGLSPVDVGLPERGRRRTPGLRREEVALLAGVSTSWYTWLEQGRDIPASEAVIGALSRALRLDGPARHHLWALCGLFHPAVQGGTDPLATARLQRLVDALAPNAAYVLDRHFDFLVWNRPYTVLWRDPGELALEERNLVWAMFADPALRSLLVEWERRSRSVLAQFRAAAGRDPGDQRFADVVSRLERVSLEFRTWWPRYQVGEFRDREHVVVHPVAGRLCFELAQLRPLDQPDVVLVLQTPMEDTDRAALDALLEAPLADR